MATRSTTKKATETQEEKVTAADSDQAPAETQEEKVTVADSDQAPSEATKPEATEPKTEMKKTVKVMNPHPRFHYVHPASGVRLGASEVKELVMDPWLEMQIKAGVLKEV